MSYKAYEGFGTKVTPQNEPIPGEAQVQNSAGGFVYAIDHWKQLERFLILGVEGGTYYVNEKTLAKLNGQVVLDCLADDGLKTVNIIVGISDGGRAVKNDPAIFALALAASTQDPDKQGNASKAIRKYALMALPQVCRIPTHLFHFLAYCKQSRRWSRMLRTAIKDWYARWPVDQLAFEMVKYQARDGWSHKDVFRLAHVELGATAQGTIRWAIGATREERVLNAPTRGQVRKYGPTGGTPAIIYAFEAAKTAPIHEVVKLIRQEGLTREMVPTEMLNHAEVWDALLEKMPVHAMLRNLGNMSKVGLLTPLSDASTLVTKRLLDPDNVVRFAKKRVHPISILIAMKIYAQGHGMKGAGTWTPVPLVVDALDAAVYSAFGALEPSGKRTLFALDVSGSMASLCAGLPITCAEGTAAMALACAKVEKEYYVMGFSSQFVDLGITPRMRLTEVLRKTTSMNFGATDCAQPMIWALANKVKIDQVVVMTDNETWYGHIHPKQALRNYRDKMGIALKQIVVGMTPTKFSIADPADPLSLDVVGFNTTVPQVVAEF